MANTVLWLDGVAMPTPSKLTITKNKVWSKNTGRSSTGTFIGDIVAIKDKLQSEWKTMSQENSALLDSIVENTSIRVKYVDPSDSKGRTVEKVMYANDPSYPVYSYVDGFSRYTGVGVNLIEL